MSAVHRRVNYFGRVQGVGFRAITRRIATGFSVSGQVKNLDDGSVEVLASGDPAEVERFLRAIDRELGSKIRDRVISEILEAPNEPSGFSIRY